MEKRIEQLISDIDEIMLNGADQSPLERTAIRFCLDTLNEIRDKIYDNNGIGDYATDLIDEATEKLNKYLN